MPRRAARRRAPARGTSGVSLNEFKQLQEVARQNAEDLKVQFRRIAQIQAELDTVKQGQKTKGPDR